MWVHLFETFTNRMTNSALAQGWHTSEGNVRRWRKDVVRSLDEANAGSADFIPANLRQMGVTPRRLEDLKNIRASRERENAEGNVVPIRTAPKEPTQEEKEAFWNQIRHDAGDYWKHGIGEFSYVRAYLAEKYGVEEGYYLYKDLTMKQLREVQGAILSDDTEFIAGCKAIGAADKKLDALKSDFRTNCGLIKKWLLKFVQGDEGSEAYKKCAKAFKEAARAAGYVDYYEDDYSYPTNDAKPETYEAANEVLLAVQRDIATTLDSEDPKDWVIWVSEFRKKQEKSIVAQRTKLEKDWVQSKKDLADAFTAYPRNISPAAFCAAMDSKHYDKDGTHFKLFSRNEIGSRVHDDTIRTQIRTFKDAARDLKADADWVQKIPSEDTPVLRLDEYVHFEIAHIYIEVTGTNGKVFHPEGAVFTNDTYDSDEDGNLKSKGMNLDAEALACLSDATKADILNVCRKNKFKHDTGHFDIEGPREEEDA